MKLRSILILSFFLGLIFVFIGAYLQITHAEGANIWLTIGLLASLVFMLISIYEVMSSTYINQSEKIMWVVGFIFLGLITGIVYLVAGRKRVVK